jgi:hypothetical protein
MRGGGTLCGKVSSMAREQQDPICADNKDEDDGAASAASSQEEQSRTSRNPPLQSGVNASGAIEDAQRIEAELRAQHAQLVTARFGCGIRRAPEGTSSLDRRNDAIAEAMEGLNERLKASLDAVIRQLELTQADQQHTVK